MVYKKAFTIVELLIVIVVIGILAAITIVSYTGIQSKAVVASLTSDLANASRQLKMFQVDNSTYPTTINCAIPDSTTNKCIKSAAGTTYTYKTSPTNISIFCLEATKSSGTYNITQEGQLLAGPCPVLNLDAGNTLSYSGTGTTWKDLSGNDRNGTLLNGVGYSSANGGTFTFDGVDDYVTLPNDIVATSSIRSNGITYSAWVKSTNTASEQRIVGQKPGSGYSDFSSGGLGVSGNKAKMTAYDDNLSYKHAVGGTTLQNNVWYFIVGTYDASDKNIRIFVNGVFDGSAIPIITFSRLVVNAENIIGTLNTASTYSLNGSISDIHIYNRTLTAAEILQNFNAQRSHYGI